MAKAKVKAPVKAKQQYNYGLGFIALVLYSLALYSIVHGFGLHLQTFQFPANDPRIPSFAVIVAWYFLGVLLGAAGKMSKWKAMGK